MRITGHPVLSVYGPDTYTGSPFLCSADGDPPGGGTSPPPPPGPPPPPPPPGNTMVTPIAPWASAGDKPWTIGDGANVKPWFDVIPEAPVKELITQKQYANPAVLATAYYNLNKITSAEEASKVLIPGKDAKPEEWDGVYTKLGRPINVEGYNDVFKFDASVKVDPETVTWGKALAFKLGLNPTQAKTMADEHNKFVAEQTVKRTQATKAANDTAVEALKAAWGPEVDSYIEGGKRVYKALGLDSKLVEALEAHIGAAPVVELMARIGKASAEGTFKSNGGGGGGNNDPNSMTPEAAAAEITRLKGDKEFNDAYTNKMHAGNKDAIERMNRLFARAGNLAPL